MAKKEKITFTIDSEFYNYTKEELEEMAKKYEIDYDKFLSQLFQIGIEATNSLKNPFCSVLVKELCDKWVKNRT